MMMPVPNCFSIVKMTLKRAGKNMSRIMGKTTPKHAGEYYPDMRQERKTYQ
jgi:hypothetical protein